MRNQHHHETCFGLPNYVQNSAGFRLEQAYRYSTVSSYINASYLHTKTDWSNHRGNSHADSIYLDAKVHYHKKDFEFYIGLLGAYSYIHATHYLTFGYPIKAYSHPRHKSIAESVAMQYTYTYNSISLTPSVTLMQSNIHLSSLHGDNPKEFNLQTESKYFRFLDTLISLKIQSRKNYCNICVNPYLNFGWHNILSLTTEEFRSRFDHYISCACNFITKTYKGEMNTVFLESGIGFFCGKNMDILFNYRADLGSKELLQGVYLGAHWRF